MKKRNCFFFKKILCDNYINYGYYLKEKEKVLFDYVNILEKSSYV